MPILLGVDTGGTYTDAVLYDDSTGRIIGKAKSPTNHEDLSTGIGAAIDAVLDRAEAAPEAIEMVSLSTTLATNALVEDKGRRACLVMVGFDGASLEHAGLRSALADDELIIASGGHSPHGEEAELLDLAGLKRDVVEVADRVEAFAVTSQFSVRNPSHELAVRDLIRECTGRPVTCSHELSAKLNGPKRGVTALLNARLIALIDELLAAADAMLAERRIEAPVMVVRGNGSLVAADFVRDRPVETILSGPAASLVGATHLVDASEGVIVDMGGTTSDIAVMHAGQLRVGADGATVGGHQTMVEAVSVSTHGLGGDSEVRLANRAIGPQLLIGPRRVAPLALVGLQHPKVIQSMLDRQLRADTSGEFDGVVLIPVRQTRLTSDLSRAEADLIDKMGGGPVAADEILRSRVTIRAMRRLVSRGLARLGAFTPTDATHVLGLQADLDLDAARAGARLLGRRRDRHGDAIADSPEQISQVVLDTVVRRAAQAVLAEALTHDDLPPEAVASALVSAALDGHSGTSRIDVGMSVPVVGLGAPASTYYPRVAALLGTTSLVPHDADVANAVGAVVGRVRITTSVTVSAPRRGLFRVHGGTAPETFSDLEAARSYALDRAKAQVMLAAKAAGGDQLEIGSDWTERSVVVDNRPYFVEGTLTVTASGRPGCLEHPTG